MAKVSKSARKTPSNTKIKEKRIRVHTARKQAKKVLADETNTSSTPLVIEKTPSHSLLNNKKMSYTPQVKKPSEKPKVRKRHNNVLREIKYFQTNIGQVILKAPLVRLVRSVMREISPNEQFRIGHAALGVIQEALEARMLHLLEMSYLCTRHAKRITLYVSDINLAHRIMTSC